MSMPNFRLQMSILKPEITGKHYEKRKKTT